MVISAAVAVVRWSFEGRDAMGGGSKDEEFERRRAVFLRKRARRRKTN